MLYFDHNATHPLKPAARAAWLEAVDRFPGNPSSPHRWGSRAEHAVETARERIASMLQCSPHDLIWTAGATESANTVVHHFAQEGVGSAWVAALEHPCVLASVRRWFPERHTFIPVTPEGVVDLEWLTRKLPLQRPGFVAVMAANNETGVLQPWRQLQSLCRTYNVPFFCDAVQWFGRLPADGLGDCDFVSGCAHKFGGPPGVGFLKVSGRLRPLLVGGPQEAGRRAGTENVPAILAMTAAFGEAEEILQSGVIAERQAWRTEFESELLQALPEVQVLGRSVDRLWNTSAVLMPALECNRRWVVKLDKLGFAVSTGSACSSGREKPSHVLAAMGRSQADAGRMLRFSSSLEQRDADWRALGAGLREAAGQLSSIGTTHASSPDPTR